MDRKTRDRGGLRRNDSARLRRCGCALLLGALLLPGGRGAADGPGERREPLVVIVHPSNRVDDLPRPHLAALFLRKKQSWPDGSHVLVVNAPPLSDLRAVFDRQVSGLSPTEAADYWIDYRIRGNGRPPLSVRSKRLLQRLVARQPGVVAYLPQSAIRPAEGKVKLLRVDGRSPGDPRYPLQIVRRAADEGDGEP